MDLKDILVFTRPDQPAAACAALAGRLARGQGALVSAVCLVREGPPDLAEGYAWGMAAIGQALARIEADIQRRAAPAEADFRKAIAPWGCATAWTLSGASEAAHESARRARMTDLVVLDRPQADDAEALALAEALVLTGGSPCLFAPPGLHSAPGRAGAFGRIAVAWDGSRPAKAALDCSLAFLKAASTVDVVRVAEDADGWEGRERDALLARLERHGVRATVVDAPRRGAGTGEALLRHCARTGADLLVMGAYGRTQALERLLGGTTRTALAQAPLPLLMSH